MDKRRYFDNNGIWIESNFICKELANDIRQELIVATEYEEQYVHNHLSEANRFDHGMVHNTFLYSDKIMGLLDLKKLDEILSEIFCENSIVYAFQSSTAPGQASNFGARIHVDCPRFVDHYVTNVGLIIALDDFCKENGATEFLRGSHKIVKKPSEAEFERGKESFICNSGDALFFNARVWHRTGYNTTNCSRNALTINFCRPFMKTRFDFPRLIQKRGLNIDPNSQCGRFLGYWTRTPIDLEDFYVSNDERLYRSGLE